jgi:glycosyltransferase involved in cell wall biosynthesis
VTLKVAMLGLAGVPATFGGIERSTEEVGARLADRGIEVVVYCRSHYTPKDVTARPYRGMRLVRLPSWNRKHTDAITHTFLAIVHGLVTGVDIFHFHSIGPGFLAPIPKLFGRRVVVQVHNMEWKGGKWGPKAQRFFRLAERVTVRFADEVLVINHTFERHYQTTHGRRTVYIPHGYSLPPIAGGEHVRPAVPKILFVGRLVPEKGCHTLIEAVKDLPEQVDVLVAGGSRHTDEYIEQLRQSAPEYVHLLGYVYGEELHRLYREATIYVQPSSREGVPLTLLDAMAFGCPIVAGDIPELREALGDCGLYAPPNSVQQLRDRIVELLTDDDLRLELGHRAAERVKTFPTWDDMTDAIHGVYMKLVPPKAPVR